MPRPVSLLVPVILLAAAGCAEMRPGMPGAAAEGGSCGAAERQDWVGQSVASLNDIDLPEGTRVLFPTTPATMDYREDRLNVEVDRSDSIARVFCG